MNRYRSCISENKDEIIRLTRKLPYDDSYMGHRAHVFALRHVAKARKSREPMRRQMMRDMEQKVIAGFPDVALDVRELSRREQEMTYARARVNMDVMFMEGKDFCEVYTQIREAMEAEVLRLNGDYDKPAKKGTNFYEIFVAEEQPVVTESEAESISPATKQSPDAPEIVNLSPSESERASKNQTQLGRSAATTDRRRRLSYQPRNVSSTEDVCPPRNLHDESDPGLINDSFEDMKKFMLSTDKPLFNESDPGLRDDYYYYY